MAKDLGNPEGVGEKFSIEGMLSTRERTKEAVQRIGSKITVGMTGKDAIELANHELQVMGMDRHWHSPLIRFGKETLKGFRQPVDEAIFLEGDDIYFVDLGVIWDGLEGDAGDTFVVGKDEQKAACAHAARDIWHSVADHWRETRATGMALHDFAAREAKRRGWTFNHDILGHRLSDFPHAIYKAGWLSEFENPPTAGLWILEIQISHPELPYGAFYEDLLIDDSFSVEN
ncbi:M24 family metallopeptidase [Parasphingorhabdus sp.]|uniref:M24 family metallopeptidase n=1 Tax=Parasphingorhabdus sp. TaxID=2709688 RepID=UPI00300188FC|tara:strand:+ start:36619 stop:37308 length:690 start_codon:yes stop_codon:yes gene_type:complete